MIKKQNARKVLFGLTLVAAAVGFDAQAHASAFQLWEQNAGGVGDYHAGGAAEANNASTSFYNPAGLVRLNKNQQVVAGAVGIFTNIPYKGTVNVNSIGTTNYQANTQGGGPNVVPNLQYSAPLTQKLVLAFGITTPFGLKTDYPIGSVLRYAATETSIKTINLSPSFGYAITDHWSIGAGFDAQYATATFDQYAGLLAVGGNLDTLSDNTGNSWGYGYHAGTLFQFNKSSRLGLSYRSRIIQNIKGKSRFVGGLANGATGGSQTSNNLNTRVILPPTTTLSYYQDLNTQWAILSSINYTQWSSFNTLILNNVAAYDSGSATATNNLKVTVFEKYRNTWNFALGTHYKASKKWLFKGGIGYDETPTKNAYRNAQLPGSNRIAVAFGVHYQPQKTLGFDVGWTHLFMKKANINVAQAVGTETVTTVGESKSSADIIGVQVEWDMT